MSIEPSVRLTVFVPNKGEDPCKFLDEHWSKQLQEKTGLLKKSTWRCSIEFNNVTEFFNYQPWLAEQLGRKLGSAKIDVDVGIYFPKGYESQSLSFTYELSANLSDPNVSFEFSFHEHEAN